MAESVSIEQQESTEDVLDIDFLKKTGIDLLQDLSGKIWTDYNIHDPGVTILEVLCFALTELGYRADYPLKDLLRVQEGKRPVSNTFFSPEKILSTQAVTINDLRRVLLDIPDIKNVEFRRSLVEKEFKGVYDLEVELLSDSHETEYTDQIADKIRGKLATHRNLGVTFGEIKFLGFDKVGFQLELEVASQVDSDELFHEVLRTIQEYLSPSVRFESYEEANGDGRSPLEIYDGPVLESGFVTETSIDKHSIRRNLYSSVLVNALMELKDVHLVQDIKILDTEGNNYNWVYEVEAGKVPLLDMRNTNISLLYKGNKTADMKSRSIGVSFRQQNQLNLNTKVVERFDRSGEPHRDLKEYSSIQHNFPANFGIGEYGPPMGADKARVAYARQLKGFLLVFDQIFANYFAQLENIKGMFSIHDVQHMSASQLVLDVPGIEYLYKPFLDEYLITHHDLGDANRLKTEWKKYLAERKENLADFVQGIVENDAVFQKRRSRILSHLIARFGYDMSKIETIFQFTDDQWVTYKTHFLQHISSVGKDRGRGSSYEKNYLKDDPVPVDGFESGLRLFLGIVNRDKGSLAQPVREVLGVGHRRNTKGSIAQAEIVFEDMDEDQALELILKHGGSREKYVQLRSSGKRSSGIWLHNDDHEPVVQIGLKHKPRYAKKKLIEEMAGMLRGLNQETEGFHLIEHIQLRPSADMPCFGFEISIDGSPIFKSSTSLTRAKSHELEQIFWEQCNDPSRFEIVEKDMKQFKIFWKNGQQRLEGCYFFESKEQARQGVSDYIDLLQSNAAVTTHTTKYEDVYNEVDDPFSNIISIIMPTWPSRFQGESFRKYAEETIAREAPAHLVVNVKWFAFNRMAEFEEAYSSYMDAQDSGDSVERERTLTQLLKELIF